MCTLARTRNGAVASSRIDINVIGGVSAPLRRNTRNVKISISDSRGAQPVTVKRRADALSEHVASVIHGETFWNFNKDWLPPSPTFFRPRCFLGHRSQITSLELRNRLLREARGYFVWVNAENSKLFHRQWFINCCRETILQG